MNTYKKLSQYLLTHQPLLWHTRFLQLMLFVVLANLIFFGIGYGTVNFEEIKSRSSLIWWFYNDYYVLYWIILGLIVLIIWAAYFFRFNAAKNFYPISRWYFHKMAFFLFLPIFLYAIIPFTFFAGQTLHARQLMTKLEHQKLVEARAQSMPFMIENTHNYRYALRAYPEQYIGVSYFEPDENEYSNYILFEDDNENIDYVLEQVNAQSILDAKEIYAYRTEERLITNIIDEDTCYDSKTYFLHALSKDSFPDFYEQHIKNFSNMSVYSDYNSFAYDEEYISLSNNVNLEMIHRWIDHEPHQILIALQTFKDQCDKYGIENNLNPKNHYNYLIEKEFRVWRSITYDIYDVDGYFNEYGEWITVNPSENKSHFYQRYDQMALSHLIENVGYAYHTPFVYERDVLMVMGFFALGITALLIYFQWGSVLAFVISIPVAGVLMILGTLMVLLISSPWREYDYYWRFPWELLVYLFFAIALLMAAFIGMKRVWNVYVTNIAFTLSYFVAPLWIVMFMLFFHGIFSHYVFSNCEYYSDYVEPFSLDSGFAYYIMIYSPYLMFLISLFFIKKFLAKKGA